MPDAAQNDFYDLRETAVPLMGGYLIRHPRFLATLQF